MIGGKLQNLSHREKLGIAAAVFLIFVVMTDNLVARAVVHRLEDLDRVTENERNTLAYNRGALKLQAEVDAAFETVRGRIGQSDSASVDMRAAKDQIDEAARRNGLSIFRMEDRDVRAAEGYAEYAVEVSRFEGDLRSVVRFIQELWDAPGMPRVTRINLAPNAGQGAGQVKGSMLITRLLLTGAASAPAGP